MSRRTRTIRYGGSILLVLAGAACGVLISGSTGGTLATVLVGLGLVGLVSLVFYEVGLTEDRDRVDRGDPPQAAGAIGAADQAPTRPEEAVGPRPGTDRHRPDLPARRRPVDRMRGHRRRLR